MKQLLKIILPVLIIMALFIVSGCASKSVTSVPPVPAPAPEVMAPSFPGMAREESDNAYQSSVATGEESSSYDRKIVKTGYISLVVEDIVHSMGEISALASSLGGYVVSSTKHETDRGVSGQVTIRVPAERYDETFDKLRQMAVKVPSENTESRDVTEEYTDLQARLKTLEATEAQYLNLLNKAQTVEDILRVQRELTSIREQIEQTKGRIQYLDRTTDMSLIQISLQEAESFEGNGWSALETLKSAVRGLVAFGKVLVNILIWLVIFIPLWIIIAVIVILVRRSIKKKKAIAQSQK